MPKRKPKLICIVGPTASGKTEWGIKLAKKFEGEIISADSRQIYQGMDVGTGKITIDNEPSYAKASEGQAAKSRSNKIVIREIPHYMINILEPDQKFTAADFKKRSLKIIRNIHKENKLPFLVGGTGLYIQSVVDNYQFPNQGETKKREKLKEKPLKFLQKKLKEIGPKTAKEIGLENKQRVIRALELTQNSNKPTSKQKKKGPPLFKTLQIGIKVPREQLYQQINRRVERMIKAGLEKEVKGLIKTYGWNHILKNTIGYKEWQSYFENKTPKEGVKATIKKNTRNYAKRQLTWFQNKGETNWVKALKKAEQLVDNFLKE